MAGDHARGQRLLSVESGGSSSRWSAGLTESEEARSGGRRRWPSEPTCLGIGHRIGPVVMKKCPWGQETIGLAISCHSPPLQLLPSTLPNPNSVCAGSVRLPSHPPRTPSWCSSHFFRHSPPPYPVRPPSA